MNFEALVEEQGLAEELNFLCSFCKTSLINFDSLINFSHIVTYYKCLM